MNIPTDITTREQRIKFALANSRTMLAHSKAYKCKSLFGDNLKFTPVAPKVEIDNDLEDGTMKVSGVSSAAYIFDMHKEVHLPGWATKTVNESGMHMMLLADHKMDRDNLLAKGVNNNLSVSIVQNVAFRELGIDADGMTETVDYSAMLRRDYNPKVFDMFVNKEIYQHSVGIIPKKVELAVDDQNEGRAYELYKNILPLIANKESVQENGYFIAVKEAQLIEISALTVMPGSNGATPTTSITMREQKKFFDMHVAQTNKQINELKNEITALKSAIKDSKPINEDTQFPEPSKVLETTCKSILGKFKV